MAAELTQLDYRPETLHHNDILATVVVLISKKKYD
jgi:hypothetical protein